MPRAPSLKKLADMIRLEWPALEVKVEPDSVSTDRKIAGSRLIHPGKGRAGNRLTVSDPSIREGWAKLPKVLLDHRSAETYRSNSEVLEWIEQRRLGRVGIRGRS